MKRRVSLFFSVAIPLLLFAVARSAASWRPQLMAPNSIEALLLTPRLRVTRSVSGRFIAYDSLTTSDHFLVDRTRPNHRQKFGWGWPVFSRDERLLCAFTFGFERADKQLKTSNRITAQLENLQTGKITQLEPIAWRAEKSFLDANERVPMFSPDGSVLTFVVGTTVVRWNVASGKKLSQVQVGALGANSSVELCAGGDKVCATSMEKFFVYNAKTGEKNSYAGTGEAIANTDFYWGDAWGRDVFYLAHISDGKRVLRRSITSDSFGTQSPVFSPDGRLALIAPAKKSGRIQAQIIKIATGETVLRKELPEFNMWAFDDNDHILTRDDKGRVYRWRLR